MDVCWNCDAPLTPGAKECAHCGAPLASLDESDSVAAGGRHTVYKIGPSPRPPGAAQKRRTMVAHSERAPSARGPDPFAVALQPRPGPAAAPPPRVARPMVPADPFATSLEPPPRPVAPPPPAAAQVRPQQAPPPHATPQQAPPQPATPSAPAGPTPEARAVPRTTWDPGPGRDTSRDAFMESLARREARRTRTRRGLRGLLITFSGAPDGAVHPFGEGRTIIGRPGDGRCDVEVEDNRVSSPHCALIARSGGVLLRDEGSTNGTFFRREEEGQFEDLMENMVRLQDGDTFQVGDTLFLVRLLDQDRVRRLWSDS